jgi:transcriptional regulator with XRE-family HTH domain
MPTPCRLLRLSRWCPGRYGWTVATGIDAGRVALGVRIREIRESSGITLADGAVDAGISYSYLSDVERGRRLPTLEVLDSIAGALGVTVVILLRGIHPWDGGDPGALPSPPRDGRRRSS